MFYPQSSSTKPSFQENCDFVGVITEDTIADTPQLNALRVPLIVSLIRKVSDHDLVDSIFGSPALS